MTPRFLLCLLLAVHALLPARLLAAESYDNCKGFIDSLPATISTKGTWCLRSNLATSQVDGNAIRITAPGPVTLDCNHFGLDGSGAGAATQTRGIYAESNSGLRLQVRNCRIRGFGFGVYMLNGNAVIEDNRLANNRVYAIYGASGNIIRNNIISATGDSSVASTAAAIAGSAGVIRGNLIETVKPRADISGNGTGYGLLITGSSTSVIDNTIRFVQHVGQGYAHGIMVYNDQSRAIVRDNEITGDKSDLGRGISCVSAQVWAAENYIRGFQYGVDKCADGGNIVLPLNI